MSRKIDLLQYLPPYPKSFAELQAIADSETPEMQAALDETDVFTGNQYIKSCNEKGVARYEQMLRIYPDAQDTLQRRVLRVFVKWTDSLPYTRRTLKQRLDALCGSGAYELDIDYAQRTLEINLLQEALDCWEDVLVTLREMIPANMGIIRCSTMDEVVRPLYVGGAVTSGSIQTELPEWSIDYDLHTGIQVGGVCGMYVISTELPSIDFKEE